eukprot:CAMPEP_0182592042 /NCGR_PEP_ID=MMETSP1324-20130603/75132_1 /TAXON_ID=236786 /ORGANISM="Florenciella sp., Strain RCC1587" /LENGTH=84 /DNA_ID=CAMNT_0024809401 /DNA_START=329 /DNA_END=583 /DNA_ORIENTATION=-
MVGELRLTFGNIGAFSGVAVDRVTSSIETARRGLEAFGVRALPYVIPGRPRAPKSVVKTVPRLAPDISKAIVMTTALCFPVGLE